MMKSSRFYIFVRNFLFPFFKIIYRFKILGKENIPKNGPYLICCNHMSYVDAVLLGMLPKGQVYYMAQDGLFKVKILGTILSKLGAFPVYRKAGISAIKKGIDILEAGGIVGVFPEGTRSKTGELLKPKPGVTMLSYETKAAILPVAIATKEGKKPKPFRKTLLKVGELMPFEELEMTDNSGMEMRKASRRIMEQIRVLKEEGVHLLQGSGSEPNE